jgi:hypothetical protein
VREEFSGILMSRDKAIKAAGYKAVREKSREIVEIFLLSRV